MVSSKLTGSTRARIKYFNGTKEVIFKIKVYNCLIPVLTIHILMFMSVNLGLIITLNSIEFTIRTKKNTEISDHSETFFFLPLLFSCCYPFTIIVHCRVFLCEQKLFQYLFYYTATPFVKHLVPNKFVQEMIMKNKLNKNLNYTLKKIIKNIIFYSTKLMEEKEIHSGGSIQIKRSLCSHPKQIREEKNHLLSSFEHYFCSFVSVEILYLFIFLGTQRILIK